MKNTLINSPNMNNIIGIAIGISGLYIIKEDWKRFRKQQDQRACMDLQEKLDKIQSNSSELVFLNKNCPNKLIEKMIMDYTNRTRHNVGLQIEIDDSSNLCKVKTTIIKEDVIIPNVIDKHVENGNTFYTNYIKP